MKIKDIYINLQEKYKWKLKIFKKWIFWIILEEEAFFMSKVFHFKITSLDKNTIKIWFPDQSKNKWLKVLDEKNISYVLIEKNLDDFQVIHIKNWNPYPDIFKVDLEDFELTKQRVLWLKKLDLEDKNEKNFLLQNKIEDLYIILSKLLIKLPKKERFYFRDKLEKIFLDTLELVYRYKYNLWDRSSLIELIFSNSIILREYCRMLYNLSIINNDNIYLDIWEKWVEILKICKWIKNRG